MKLVIRYKYVVKSKSVFQHDSGGPAVRDGVLIGIVSFGGKRCGDPQSPGVYSRVSEITKWVQNTILSNEANTVRELIPKITKAREREKELQRFKARVEDKKNKIRIWLRETLNSPGFIELAKRKLNEAGYNLRRSNGAYYEPDNSANMDDEEIDEINLNNLINERVVEDVKKDNEAEMLLHALALEEAITFDKREPILRSNLEEPMNYTFDNELNRDEVEDLITFISNME